MVGFILKNLSSLNQIPSPPKMTTSKAVINCIFDNFPVKAQSIAVVVNIKGINKAVATIKPSYSLPDITNTWSLILP